jgi:hypothetical protein
MTFSSSTFDPAGLVVVGVVVGGVVGGGVGAVCAAAPLAVAIATTTLVHIAHFNFVVLP